MKQHAPAPATPALWWIAFPTAITLLCLSIWATVVILNIVGQIDPANPQTDPHKTASAWYAVQSLYILAGWSGITVLAFAAAILGTTSPRRPPHLLGTLTAIAVLFAITSQMTAILFPTLDARSSIELTASAAALVAAIFAVIAFFITLPGRPGYDVGHLFLLAAAEWLLLATSADTFYHIRYLGPHLFVAPDARAQVALLLFAGFVANLIMGIGVRLFPTLLGITRGKPRAWLVAAGIYNVGAILALIPNAGLQAFGGGLLAAGIFFYSAGISFFRSTTARTRPAATLIRAAMFALLCATIVLALQPALKPHISSSLIFDAWDHTLRLLFSLGLIGSLALGTALRLSAAITQPRILARPFLSAIAWAYLLAIATWLLGLFLIIADYDVGFTLIAVGATLQSIALVIALFTTIRAQRSNRRGFDNVPDALLQAVELEVLPQESKLPIVNP